MYKFAADIVTGGVSTRATVIVKGPSHVLVEFDEDGPRTFLSPTRCPRVLTGPFQFWGPYSTIQISVILDPKNKSEIILQVENEFHVIPRVKVKARRKRNRR